MVENFQAGNFTAQEHLQEVAGRAQNGQNPRSGWVWLGLVGPDQVRSGLVGFGQVCLGLVRFGQVCLGLVSLLRFGQVCSGLAGFAKT